LEFFFFYLHYINYIFHWGGIKLQSQIDSFSFTIKQTDDQKCSYEKNLFLFSDEIIFLFSD
jgi:hypothetical protein